MYKQKRNHFDILGFHINDFETGAADTGDFGASSVLSGNEFESPVDDDG